MSLLVFYVHHGLCKSEILVRRGDGIVINGLHGPVVSLRTDTHEEKIFTPVCVFDDSSTPPTLLMKAKCAVYSYRHLLDMPRFYSTEHGIFETKTGARIF